MHQPFEPFTPHPSINDNELLRFKQLEFDTWDLYLVCVRDKNITENELWILLAMEQSSDEPLSQATLSRVLRIPVQTINSACMKMVRRGWIKLVPIPGNRKTKGLAFTEKGEQECLPMLKKIREAEEATLSSIAPDDFAHMLATVELYNQYLRKQLALRFAPSDETE